MSLCKVGVILRSGAAVDGVSPSSRRPLGVQVAAPINARLVGLRAKTRFGLEGLPQRRTNAQLLALGCCLATLKSVVSTINNSGQARHF